MRLPCNLTSATLPIRCSALSMTRSIRGVGAFWQAGIPQPRPGAVCETHGGILFIDEIGELHPIQMNKLLKIPEDRVAHFQNSYYSRRNRDIPPYIHEIFQKGIPVDFRLVGATTCSPAELPEALRSRCTEIFFDRLYRDTLVQIAQNSLNRRGLSYEEGLCGKIAGYAHGGSGLTVTGILEEEEIKSRQGSARRKRNARSAAENALTLLEQFGFSKQDYHAHINFPGGIPIDGPSAGAAMFLALYSAYTETPVPNTLALTGEIGLHGQILPMGGVEDKLEAAQQAGATLALIPQENWREVYREMEIEVVPVGDAETLLRRVFPPGEGATLSEGMEFLVGQEIG